MLASLLHYNVSWSHRMWQSMTYSGSQLACISSNPMFLFAEQPNVSLAKNVTKYVHETPTYFSCLINRQTVDYEARLVVTGSDEAGCDSGLLFQTMDHPLSSTLRNSTCALRYPDNKRNHRNDEEEIGVNNVLNPYINVLTQITTLT